MHYEGCWREHFDCAQDRIRLLENKLQTITDCFEQLGIESLTDLAKRWPDEREEEMITDIERAALSGRRIYHG